MLYFCADGKKIKTIVIIVVLCGILAVVSVLKTASMPRQVDDPNATDYAQRVAFLKDLGVTVDPSENEQKKDIYIPTTFSDVYQQYNALQKKAGYNLSNYKGKTVTQYTLKLLKYCGRDDIYAHLLVYDNKIIGGDIAATAINGFMLPLMKQCAETSSQTT